LEVAVNRVAAFIIALVSLPAAAALPSAPTDYVLTSRETPLTRIAVIGDSYTTGTPEGGQGSKTWTSRAWQQLTRQGIQLAPDVAAEGGAGYGVPGDHGNVFAGLANRVIRPDDALVVFYGSRNDQPVDPALMSGDIHDALEVARRVAPKAQLLVIGPPWPTADVPPVVTNIRDVLANEAHAEGATFVDPIAERWFVGSPELIGPDGVHPTDAGHAYMANKIAPLIGAQLPKKV
jgi:lysophospholipase L1-like esterase